MQAQTHQSDPGILGRRTLERDHRYLARVLRPGLAVLDVGCGTGAITADIAKAVGPAGEVAGVDRDSGLLELARAAHGTMANLRFETGDATCLRFRSQFDIVTAARTLQWIAEPDLAVLSMKQATKASGSVVVLDYNHSQNEWKPAPPDAFTRFYRAFLQWRGGNHWDNAMADHLPELLRVAGLAEVESHVEDEVVTRGDAEFAERSRLWLDTITALGGQIASSGLLTGSQLEEARDGYARWIETGLITQRLVLRAVAGAVR